VTTVIVKGGTGGGRLMGKKKNPLREPWICPTCHEEIPYYWKVCPNDGTRRPDVR
jgi:hypothetical protein